MNQEELKQWLIELLNETFAEQYEKRGLLTAPHTAEALLANGVTIRERGEWIVHEGYAECGRCHAKTIYAHDLCPHCGADMRGVKDEFEERNT